MVYNYYVVNMYIVLLCRITTVKQTMKWFLSTCLLMLVASLLQAKAVIVYHIQPTDHTLPDHSHYTLQDYINHTP